MRDYGKIHTMFWSSKTMAGLDSDARLLAVYLLTSQHTTMAGAFRLPEAYACEDLGWSKERFQNSLETLSKPSVEFIRYDASSKWVWIINFIKFNRPDNPNQWKAVRKLIAAIPDSVEFKTAISETVSETVREPLGNTPVPVPVPVPVPAPIAEAEKTDLAIPLENGEFHEVTLAELAEYELAYPRLDVAGEIRKARAWCYANPANRKTARGVGKFVNGWLARAFERMTPPKPENVIPMHERPGGGRRAL